MKITIIILLTFIIDVKAYSQAFPILHAKPVIGWDSLKRKIGYPEIARRAGIQAIVFVRFSIDSTGYAKVLYISSPDLFTEQVRNIIQQVKWLPENPEKNQWPNWYILEIRFELEQPDELNPSMFTIKAQRPNIRPEN